MRTIATSKKERFANESDNPGIHRDEKEKHVSRQQDPGENDGIEAQLDSVRMRFDPHEHPAAFRIMAVRMM